MSGENICPLPSPATLIQSSAEKLHEAKLNNDQKGINEAKAELNKKTRDVANPDKCKLDALLIAAARRRFEDSGEQCKNVKHEDLFSNPKLEQGPADLEEAVRDRGVSCEHKQPTVAQGTSASKS